jgi:hypothetical protein
LIEDFPSLAEIIRLPLIVIVKECDVLTCGQADGAAVVP